MHRAITDPWAGWRVGGENGQGGLSISLPGENGQGGHHFPHPGVILTDDTNTLSYF